MAGLVDSELPNEPLSLCGLEQLQMNLLDDDIDQGIDIDDLLSIFDDDPHTPSDTRVSQNTGISATPTTSESGNGNLPLRSSSDKEDVTHNSLKHNINDEKRLARMKRNRENAHLSRLRKKQQLLNLQQSCQKLKHQNSQLNLFIQRLAAENCLLRHHLIDVCKNARFAVPSVPSVLSPSEVRSTSHKGSLSANSNKVTHLNTTAVEKHTSGDICRQSPPKIEEKRSLKRKKLGGAGAAFLTLFSIFLFAGPIGLTSNADDLETRRHKFLPEGQLAPHKILSSAQGRSLMEVRDPVSEGIDLSDYFSQTVETLLKDKKNVDLPKHALSSLEDIAPHALSLDKDTRSSNSRQVLPASSVFPALAERFFESSGLEGPQVCNKVFTVHSNDMSRQYQQRSKKNIEKYITGTHGFKGRSSGIKIKETKMEAKSPELVSNKDSNNFDAMDEMLISEESSEPQIVSILLPANSSRATRSGITAIDHLYVVILDPESTFSTYSCQLPKSLIV